MTTLTATYFSIICKVSSLTFHISSSEYRPRGSRFVLMLPLKSVGSWGMMLSFVLKSFNPIEHMLIPSMRMSPLDGSTKRNKALISVLFPLPVLPTTPTLLPSLNVQVIPLRTNGALGRYLIWNQCTKNSYHTNFFFLSSCCELNRRLHWK